MRGLVWLATFGALVACGGDRDASSSATAAIIRPVVDVPAATCASELQPMLLAAGVEACPDRVHAGRITYVRARVGAHEVVHVWTQLLDGDDSGRLEDWGRRESALFVDGTRVASHTLGVIGDVRAADAASQRALLLAALRSLDCRVATDAIELSSIAEEQLDDLPVGFGEDEGVVVLRGAASCINRRAGGRDVPTLLRLTARPGSSGVALTCEVLEVGDGLEPRADRPWRSEVLGTTCPLPSQ